MLSPLADPHHTNLPPEPMTPSTTGQSLPTPLSNRHHTDIPTSHPLHLTVAMLDQETKGNSIPSHQKGQSTGIHTDQHTSAMDQGPTRQQQATQLGHYEFIQIKTLPYHWREKPDQAKQALRHILMENTLLQVKQIDISEANVHQ